MEETNLEQEDLNFDPCAIQFNFINVLWLVLYATLFIVAVGGNFLVCCVVFGQKSMRTVTNIFLLNLAISDIAKGLICIPFTFVVNVLVPYWPFGDFMCPFVLYTQAVTVFLSAFTLVAMSVDRYVAIIYPLRPKLTSKKAIVTLLVVWLLALAVPLPTVVNSHVIENPYKNGTDCQRGLCLEVIENVTLRHIYSMALMCIQYFVPLAVLTFTFTRIGYIIWIKRTPGEAERRRDERIASSKRKMVKMMIVMVLTYAVCWLPLHTLQLIQESHNNTIYDFEHYQFVWTTTHWLAMSYACYNPIVYFWMNKRFNSAFKGMLFFLTHCKKGYGHSVGNGQRSRLPQRTNSGSSSRYSQRGSLEETRIIKLSFLQKEHGEYNDV